MSEQYPGSDTDKIWHGVCIKSSGVNDEQMKIDILELPNHEILTRNVMLFDVPLLRTQLQVTQLLMDLPSRKIRLYGAG